jgi:hypothetical protein
MRRTVLSILAMIVMGCSTAATQAPGVEADVATLAGKWQGWLVGEQGSFTLVNMDIKPDGAFQITGQWIRASGLLVVTDGRLRFDGTGAWRGTLSPSEDAGRSALALERDDRQYRGKLRRIAME